MTPIQKLLRLKELTRAIQLAPPVVPSDDLPPALEALLTERDAILASVAAPPDHVVGQSHPGPWGYELAQRYPAIDQDTAILWFQHAITAGFNDGARAFQAKHSVELIDTLRLVRNGLISGAIHAKRISDNGAPSRPLVELIVEALAGAGVTE